MVRENVVEILLREQLTLLNHALAILRSDKDVAAHRRIILEPQSKTTAGLASDNLRRRKGLYGSVR